MLSIDHNLLLASDLEAMRAFLVDVVGAEEGLRPPFPFPGYWLYSGGRPLFHLASANADVAQRAHLGSVQRGGNGPIDHISLTGADLAAVAQRAARNGYAASLREVPLSGERQLFVQGPDGLKIELLELLSPPATSTHHQERTHHD